MFLSAQGPSLSIPARDASRLRFCRLTTPPRRRLARANTLDPPQTATQDFFRDDFGLPLTIKPNFEDKSCDFYFGLTPPPIEEDEALTFGCNATCGTALDVGVEGKPCHKLRASS